MRSMRRWLWAFAAALLLTAPALRSRSTAAVCRAASPTRRRLALPGAQVTLRNDATGVVVTRTTGPEGRYLFDYVDPGTYTLTAELSGFATVVQRNVLVQARGDVTVDVTMKIAGLTETVTVEHSPVAIQFNTSSKDLTLDQKAVQSLPIISRNPTQLAYLSPVVRNAGNKNETSPYHHWAGNDMDVGGGTFRRNDVLLDGTPLEAGPKVAYTPPMDAIAEFNVATNAVDAEFGHSAGGIISDVDEVGDEPVPRLGLLRRTQSRLECRDQPGVRGSTATIPTGRWAARSACRSAATGCFCSARSSLARVTEVLPRTLTLPTELERQGDFSQSINRDGSLRVIYDPWTSRFAADGRTIIRDPFPGNRIPRERWDPLAARLIGSFWTPEQRRATTSPG